MGYNGAKNKDPPINYSAVIVLVSNRLITYRSMPLLTRVSYTSARHNAYGVCGGKRMQLIVQLGEQVR